MDALEFVIKGFRKIYRTLFVQKKSSEAINNQYVEFFDEDANEVVRQQLLTEGGSMICKFGTIELSVIDNYLSIKSLKKFSIKDVLDYIQCKRRFLYWYETLDAICKNAGFFPRHIDLLDKFVERYLQDMNDFDVLGSYDENEKGVIDRLSHCLKINIEGYYCPFIYENPWTEELRGKKVLVVHPFAKSIENQYKKRELLFDNPKVLPEFELITIKAVQTIAGEKTEFETWFDALKFMEEQISNVDFDIALIGCGAYGMPLAAHVKRMGKKSVHLAGWTQMLFGIYGNRWLNDQPKFAKYINEYWTKPLPEEVPQNFKKVENGCYW
jgi:hypothetical protein